MTTQVATPAAYRLLHAGSLVFAEMEASGIRIDTDYLDRTIAETGQRIRDLEQQLQADPLWAKWQQRFNDKANLGSRPQLAELLFDGEQLPYTYGRTATGKYRMDDEVLRGLQLDFAGTYLKLEELKKFRGTSLEGLRRETVDGYVHPVQNLHLVETYRSSSDSPNLHNFPRRDEELGPMVRRAFVPRKGRVLVENDFAAHEFRIAAAYWGDPAMVRYVKDPKLDIHRDMAAACYVLQPEQVSKPVRDVAKNSFTFPKLYGSYCVPIGTNMWNAVDGRRLVTTEGVPLKRHLKDRGIRKLEQFITHIESVEKDWEERFPVWTRKKIECWRNYEQTGSFTMPTGFVVQGVYSRNFRLNAPVQGIAFHCLLWTCIRLYKRLRQRKMKALLVGQIHDCILCDCPKGELQDYLDLVQHIVSVELPRTWDWLTVPLEIEAEIAETNWAEKRQWVKQEGVWAPKA